MHRIQSVAHRVQHNIGMMRQNAFAWLAMAMMWLMSATTLAAQPVFSQNFSPTPITLLGETTLVYTIDNTANVGNVTTMSFSDVLTSGIKINGSATTTCGSGSFPATITLDEDSGSVSLFGNGINFAGFHALPAGASCTVTIPVQGQSVGPLVNTSADLMYRNDAATSDSSAGASTATLVVEGAPVGAPLLIKSYDPSTVDQGATLSATYTITNTSRTEAMTDLAFTDVLNDTVAGLTYTSLTANTCGGAVAGDGTTTLSLANGTLAAEATCNISVVLTAPTGSSGSFSGSTNAITATAGGATVTGNAAIATIEVRADAAPTLAMSFTDTAAGGSTTGTFTLTNLATAALTDGTFSFGIYPPLPETATLTLPSNPCGVSSSLFSSLANATTVLALNNGNIPASDSCTFTVDIAIPSDLPSGPVTFTSNDPSATINAATVTGVGTSTTFNVGGGQNATFSKSFAGDAIPGGTVDLTFEISAPAENSATLAGLTFTDDLDAMLTGVTGQSGAASDTCGGALTGSSTLSYTGGTLAPGASCAITVTLDVPLSAASGTFTNTTSDLTDAATQSFGVATASLTVSDLTFDLEYTDDPVIAGGAANLEFTITNENTSFDATGLIFTYNLGVVGSGVVATGAPISACGGTLSGTSFLVFSGGTATAGGSCVISVPVSVPGAIASGTYNTSTSALSATLNGTPVTAPAATGVLVVESATLLVAQAFNSSTLAGQTVGHTYTIENQSGAAVSALSLTGNLTTLVVNSTFASVGSDTCGFTVGGVGSTVPALTAGSIAAGATCAVTLNYAIDAATSAGGYPYSATTIQGDVGGLTVVGSDSASTLTVTANAVATFSKSFTPSLINVDGSSTVTYTIDNPVGGANLTNMQFNDDLGGAIAGATISGVPGAGACGAGSNVSGGSTITLTGGALSAGQSCVFTVTVTVGAAGAGSTNVSTTSALSDTGLQVAAAVSDTLTVNVAPPLFSLAIAPATIAQGGAAVMTYTIDNTAGTAAVSAVSFNDDVPTSAVIAATPAATNSCGGTLGAGAGTTGISLNGATIGAGATCTITIPVTSATVGAASNTSSVLTTAVGTSPAVSGTLTVTAAPIPPFAMTFAPDTIVEGATSVVTYSIDNSGALIDATGVTLSNTLPTGVAFLPTPAATTTCGGGTLSAAGGALSYTGGTVTAGASCTITATVVSVADAAYVNTTSDLTSSLGNSGTASDTLTVTNTPAPLTAQTIAPATIAQGGEAVVTYSIDNSVGLIAATTMSLNNTLPTGVVVAPTPGVTNTCGGTITAAAGAGSVTFANGTVAAGATCEFSVTVRGLSAGNFTNSPAALVTSFGTGGPFATANLAVTVAPTPTLSASFVPSTIAQGGTSIMTIDISNAGSLLDLTNMTLYNNAFPTGLTQTTPSNQSTTCVGATLGGTIGGDVARLSITGGTLAAGATCQITAEVTTVTAGAAAFTTGTMSSNVTTTGTASATLTVTAAPPVVFTQAFNPATIVQGADSVVTFTLDNTGSLIDATNVDFLNTFAGDLKLAATPNIVTTCTGGSVNGAFGLGGNVSYTNGTVPAGATCTFTANVTSNEDGTFNNLTGDLTSSLGNSGTSTAPLVVTPAPLPVFTATLNPTTIIQGAETRVTLNIDNSGALVPATTLAANLILPADVTLSPNPNPSGDCTGGVATPIAGGASFTATSLAAGGTCSVSFNVVASEDGSRTFTTGDLTSSLGNSGTASATLTITPAPIPTFGKAFDVAAMEQGDVARLTFTINNPTALVDASAGAFSDTFPTNMVVAPTPNLTTSCSTSSSTSGTFTGAAGANTVALAGAVVAAGENCTYGVNITVPLDGSYTNTSGSFTSSLGDSGAAVASINVTPADVPAFSKTFAPDSMEQGDVTTLTLRMDNSTALVPATGGGVLDTFPTGMVVAATPNIVASCSDAGSTAGSATGAAGSGAFTVSGVTIAAGDICTYSVDVTAADASAFVNTTGDFTSSLGNSGIATDTLTTTAAAAPAFTKSFTPDSIVQGDVTTLSFAIDNATALVSATTGAFSDTFPAGLVIADTPNLTSTCSTAGSVTGTAVGAAGAGAYSVSGITLEAGANCTYTVDVTAAEDAVYANTSDAFTSSLGNSGTAAATLTVTGAPIPDFTKAFGVASMVQGDVTSLTFTIDNSGSLVDATAVGFGDTFPTGMVVADPANAATTCAAGTVSATAGDGSMGFAGGTITTATSCTVSLDVTSATVGSAVNLSDVLSTSLGDTAAGATDTVEIIAAPTLDFSKSYAPDSIEQGTTTTATYTIDNSGALIDATTVAFSDTLPSGAVVATPSGATNTCGGTLTASAGASTISFAGGTVFAGEGCQIAVDVTASEVGSTTLATSDLTSSLGNSGTAAAALTVTAADNPGFAKSFAPDRMVQGDVSTLTFTIDNGTAFVDATALDFTDVMPAGMVVADTPNASTTCSAGTITATAGSDTVSYSGGTLASAATCIVKVDVTSQDAGRLENVSGDLTSSLGNSGTARDILRVTGAPNVQFKKSFDVSSIVQGGTMTLTHTIDNSRSLIDVANIAFTESFPNNTVDPGAQVASPVIASTTCSDATLSVTAQSGGYSLSGGTLAAGATCSVSVQLLAQNVGTFETTGGDLTSTRGSTTPKQASIEVTPAGAPEFSKAFSPATISQNQISTLTFTIDNSAALVDAFSAGFVDTFPAGMTVADVPNVVSTCASGITDGTAGAGSFSLFGGTIAAGSVCTLQVDVTSTTVGKARNKTDNLRSSLGNSGKARAVLDVRASGAPLFTNAYVPAQITQGGSTTLVFTINNSANFQPVGSVGFNANLPSGLTVSGSNGFGATAMSTTCGGTVVAPAGASTVGFSGGTAPAASSCTVSVPVTSTSVGTLGAVTGSLTSEFGGATVSSAGSAPLVVIADPEGRVTFVQESLSDATFSFASSEAALNFSISTSGGTGSSGAISVAAGTYTITQSRPDGFGNTSLSCTDADSTVDVVGGVVTLRLGSFENVTCTFSSGNSAQLASETINSFLNRRANLILSNGPSRGRRLSRLNQGIGTSQRLAFQNGDLNSMSPVDFNLLTLGSGNYSLSTSLSQVERAGTMFALAHDGDADRTATLANRRFDVWFEAHYSKFEASQGSSGHFGIAYFGADYLINKDVLAGFLVQYDTFEDKSVTNNSAVDGTGWMAGPYLTARLAPNLIFDGRLAYGKSNNDFSTSLSTGNFDTDRWLVDVNLSGNFDYRDWVISPNVNISYIEENQHAFTDSLNSLVGAQTVSLGQIKFGPTFSTTYVTTNKVTVQPSFTLNGVYNFASRSGPQISNNTADETNGFRGRIEAAVKLTNRYGTQVDLGANYDGIGKSEFASWGLKFGLHIPLQ